jgi:hypothetical protein
MNTMHRLVQTARQSATRRRQQTYIAAILRGRDTTFRSELIEVIHRAR